MKYHATASSALKPTNFHISTQNSTVMEMGMDVNNGNQISAFFLLSSSLYKDPYRAIIRELVSNAIDASKAVSTSNTSEVSEAQPVILNVPKTIDSDDFYVQDFGIGMTLEQVINVYGNYFASNKQNDSNSIGGFGLGGKTPFIYVKDNPNGFKLETTSPEDNVRRTFVFKMQANQYGGLQPVYSYLDELDQPNSKIKGTKISFKLNDSKDISVFVESISDILFSLYPIQFTGVFEENNTFQFVVTKLIKQNLGNDVKDYQKIQPFLSSSTTHSKPIQFSDDFSYIPCNLNKNINNPFLVLGNIFYSYKLDKNTSRNQKFKKLQTIQGFIKKLDNKYVYPTGLPIFYSDKNGILTFSLSRENIQETEDNTQIISNMINAYLDSQIKVELEHLNVVINKLGKKYLKQTAQADTLIKQVQLYQSIISLIENNTQYNLLEESLLKKLQDYVDSLENVHKIQSFIILNLDFITNLYNGKVSFKTENTLPYFEKKNTSFLNTKKNKFLIFDNVKDFANKGWVKDLLRRHMRSEYGDVFYIVNQEQYEIIKANYDINPNIFVNFNQILQVEMIKQEKEKEQQELVKIKRQKQKEAKKQEVLALQEKMLQNETNGFYLVDFVKNFRIASNKNTILPKELKASIHINPVVLPQTLKLPVFADNEVISKTLIKNIQFLANFKVLSFESKRNQTVLRGLSYLKKTNDFLNKYIKFEQIDKRVCFRNSDGRFNSIHYNEMFYGISQLIPFHFESNLEEDFDLSQIDLHQYILDEIQDRLNYIYQELDKQIDIKMIMKEKVKKYIIDKYSINNSEYISGIFKELYKPFISLLSKQFTKINETILDVKLNDCFDEWVEAEMKKLDGVDKFTIVKDLSKFFSIVNEYRKIIGHENINEYHTLMLARQYDKNIIEKLLEMYPIKQYQNVDFKYSKEFYVEFVKPIINQLD